MSRLYNMATQQRLFLITRSVVGRDPTSHLLLDHPLVSEPQALIRWDSRRLWTARDLQSTNGTWHNGERLVGGAEVELREGDRLIFGSPEAGEWEVGPIVPPLPQLVHLGRRAQIVGSADEVVLEAGGQRWELVREGDHWILRGPEGESDARNGMSVGPHGAWTVWLPMAGSTVVARPLSVHTATFVFEPHEADEGVSVHLLQDGRRCDLPEGSHWRLAWILADERKHLPATGRRSKGWVAMADLTKRSGLTDSSIAVYIGRMCKELTAARALDASAFIDVRRGFRRIGVEPDRLET